MKYIFFTSLLLYAAIQLSAHTPYNRSVKSHKGEIQLRGFCANSESSIDQDINDVRARLLGGGDCWWDFSDGRCIVPKVDPTTGQKEVSSILPHRSGWEALTSLAT